MTGKSRRASKPTCEELEQRIRILEQECAKGRHAEEALQKERRQLRERVKELGCLYSLSELMERPGTSFDEILQGTADLLPSGWQHPDAAQVRIILDGHEYTSKGFEEGRWRLAEDIVAHGRKVGVVEVFYVNDGPKWDEGPFLKEERDLIHAVAERLGRITERMRAEELIRESEEQHRTILQTAMDGFWVTDVQGRILEVNDAYCRMSGYSKEELLTMYISHLEAAETADDIGTHGRRIMAQGEHRFESRHRCKDGSLLDVEVSVQYRAMEGGRFVAFFRDITDRNRAEEALRKAKEFSESLVASMQDGFSILDSHGVHLDVNSALCQMTGFSKEELVGVGPPHPYWPPEALEDINRAFQKTLEGNFSDFELTFMRKNGERFPVIVSPSWIRDEQGNVISYFATFKDITERKRAEKEALDLKNTQLKSFVNNIPDLAWIKDSESNYIAANRTFAQTVGMPPEFLINNPCEVCFGEDAGRKFREEDRKVMESGKQIILEEEVVDSEGKRLWLETIKSPIFDDFGKVIGTVGIARDITERMRAREVLQQSEKKLRLLSSHLLSAQEVERKRIAKELHDQLGQDLVGLKLHVGAIKRELSERKTTLCREFESVQEDIDEIIEDVRRLSRDLGPYALEHLGLWQALRHLTEDLAEHYLVESSFDMDNNHNGLLQSAQLNIFRVFQEALTNIQKHSEAARVSIEVCKKNGNLSFSIEDDGRGFDLTQVLEEGPTEKGLGLVIMEERIRMLGGDFEISSQQGKGTRISFTVPVDGEEKQR